MKSCEKSQSLKVSSIFGWAEIDHMKFKCDFTKIDFQDTSCEDDLIPIRLLRKVF